MPRVQKEKSQKITTCDWLELGSTRILTNYAPKCPQTLAHEPKQYFFAPQA
jgi:hypothetical protein